MYSLHYNNKPDPNRVLKKEAKIKSNRYGMKLYTARKWTHSDTKWIIQILSGL